VVEGFPIASSFPIIFKISAFDGAITSPDAIAYDGEIGWTTLPDSTLIDNFGLGYLIFTKKDPLDTANRISIARVDLTVTIAAASALEWGAKTASKEARISSIRFRTSGLSFIAAGMVVTTNPSLLVFQADTAGTANKGEWVLIADQLGGLVAPGGGYDFISYIDTVVDGGVEYFYAIAEGTSVSALNRGFTFIQIVLPSVELTIPTVWATKRYNPLDSRVFECVGVGAISATAMQAMLYDVSSQTAFYAKFDFTQTTFELTNLYTDV